MAVKEKAGHCPVCKRQKLFRSTGINHILHIFLTIITGGFWGFVYGFLLTYPKTFRCTECGTKKG